MTYKEILLLIVEHLTKEEIEKLSKELSGNSLSIDATQFLEFYNIGLEKGFMLGLEHKDDDDDLAKYRQ
jgi:hypothetical protein